jgi:histidinol-phosphatase (PHP family)
MYNFTDLHLHTAFSWDAQQTIEELKTKAFNEDVNFLGLTEHLDFHNNHKQSYLHLDYPAYTKAVESAKRDFPGFIKGVEAGEPHMHRELYEKWMKGKEFDFIAASVHWIDGATPVFEEYFKKYPSFDDAYKKYFEEIYNLVNYGNFDVAAHLTLVHRQGARLYREYSYEKYKKEIDDILKVMIKKDISLEINCSGIRFPAKALIPDERVIKAYIDLGGNSFTVGSDSHSITNTFFGLGEGYGALERLGVEEITVYEKRKKIKIPLIKET